MANFHTGTTVSPESQPATTESPIRPRDIILLICWLLACGGLVFWRSFHVSYSFDDVAHLHALAAYRSGEISLTQFLLHNHNEHFLPLVRLYFMAATKISGLSSASMHVFLFLNYVAGAFACAWIAFSLTRSRLASFLAGTIFVGAAGFIGSMLWQPSDGEFSVAGTPLIFAIAILVSPYTRKRWTDVAVLGLVFVAALGLGSITVPALAIPDLCVPGETRHHVTRQAKSIHRRQRLADCRHSHHHQMVDDDASDSRTPIRLQGNYRWAPPDFL